MKKIIICIVAVLVSGCGGVESDIKKAILADLKDPGSARFGSYVLVDETHACMTVNAKNSMGGYTGDQQAFMKKVEGKWNFVLSDDVSQEWCVEMWPQIDK